MIELFNGSLTLNQTVMRGLRESSDGVGRGFLLILFVGLLVGAANGFSALIQNATPERTIQFQRDQLERQIDQLVLSSNDTSAQELTRLINENKDPVFDLIESLITLPTPLPRPVGLGFQLVATIVSTPLVYLSGMLLAAVASHIAARQLGGQGHIQQMVALGSLSVAPHALDALAFIPGLGGTLSMIAWVWGLVILVLGTAVAHKLDTLRAAMAVLLYPLVLLLLSLLVSCLLIAVLLAVASGAR